MVDESLKTLVRYATYVRNIICCGRAEKRTPKPSPSCRFWSTVLAVLLMKERFLTESQREAKVEWPGHYATIQASAQVTQPSSLHLSYYKPEWASYQPKIHGRLFRTHIFERSPWSFFRHYSAVTSMSVILLSGELHSCRYLIGQQGPSKLGCSYRSSRLRQLRRDYAT